MAWLAKDSNGPLLTIFILSRAIIASENFSKPITFSSFSSHFKKKMFLVISGGSRT
jgi:hypothetical protein